MSTDEKYKSIGGEKFWYEALESAWNNIYGEAIISSSLYTADIMRLYELVKAEIDHIADFEGMDKLPWYSKRFVEDWRDLNVEEAGEEAVESFEKDNGPIYKRLSPLTSWDDKHADFDQILRRFKLLVKFGIDSGIFTLKERESPWEIITSKITFPIDQSLKDNESVKELARFIKEDREDTINQRDALQWAFLYMNYLKSLKNGSITLEYRKMIEGEDRGPDNSFSSFIKTNLLRTGMVSVLYGKAGTGKSHFLSWLIFQSY